MSTNAFLDIKRRGFRVEGGGPFMITWMRWLVGGPGFEKMRVAS